MATKKTAEDALLDDLEDEDSLLADLEDEAPAAPKPAVGIKQALAPSVTKAAGTVFEPQPYTANVKAPDVPSQPVPAPAQAKPTMGDLRMAESPAGYFQEQGGVIKAPAVDSPASQKSRETTLGVIDDASSLTTRAAGSAASKVGITSATGGKEGTFLEGMADPSASYMRKPKEWLAKVIADKFSDVKDEEKSYIEKVGSILLGELAGAGYFAATLAEDPAALITAPAKAASKTASASKGVGEAIQNSILKPREAHIKGGFDIQNVFKHGVEGGVDDVLEQSGKKIEDLGGQLKAVIAKSNTPTTKINIDQLVNDVIADIKRNPSKPENIAILNEVGGAAKKLKAITKAISKNGNVDLVEAQNFKQGMGIIGDWEAAAGKSGMKIDRTESALSQLASRVYGKAKAEIEGVTPAELKEINQQLSELIPIRNAAAVRKIVADRNNTLSMSDLLSMVTAAANGPGGMAMFGATRASKSGAAAKKLYRIGEALEITSPRIKSLLKAIESTKDATALARLTAQLEKERLRLQEEDDQPADGAKSK